LPDHNREARGKRQEHERHSNETSTWFHRTNPPHEFGTASRCTRVPCAQRPRAKLPGGLDDAQLIIAHLGRLGSRASSPASRVRFSELLGRHHLWLRNPSIASTTVFPSVLEEGVAGYANTCNVQRAQKNVDLPACVSHLCGGDERHNLDEANHE
jgi:hypothetical protein